MLRSSSPAARAAALIAMLASLALAARAQAAVDPLSGRSVAPVFSGPFAEVPRAGDAPPAVDPTWLYKGKRISPSTGADRELKCLDDETLITRCFDTEWQLEAAEASLGLAPGAGSDGVVASAARKILRRHKHMRRHKHKSGRSANHTGTSGPLSLWRDSPPGGWRVDTYSSCTWFDLPGSYNNATSYSNSGAHTAALADGYGGAGYRAWMSYTYTNYDWVYWQWNDVASSRARGGIGCGIP